LGAQLGQPRLEEAPLGIRVNEVERMYFIAPPSRYGRP
jgi:hypothetical protein